MKPSTSFSACISRPACRTTAVINAVITAVINAVTTAVITAVTNAVMDTAAARQESAARAQEQRRSITFAQGRRRSITRAPEGKLMPVAGADRAGS